MSNLANVLTHQGKLGEAELLYRKALEASREVLGARHSATLDLMNNLANLLSHQGKLDKAEPQHSEVLEVSREPRGAGGASP